MTYPIAAPVAPGTYITLPGHEVGYKSCLNCGEEYNTETYEEYVAGWYATEYEGPVIHSDGGRDYPEPNSREVWEYLRDSCLAGR